MATRRKETSSSTFLDQRFLQASLAIVVLLFASVFPTLHWQEFSSSMEALNVATALEIRRSGHWLIPTLQGETRLAKPPLTAWLTALALDAPTVAATSSPDPAKRDLAFQSVALRVRSVSLLAACLTILATCYTGRLLRDSLSGLLAGAVLASCFLFLRFARYSMTDLHLMLWVSITNLALLHARLRQRWRVGFVGGGFALALAMMSKGPVALVQTVAPLIVALLWCRGRFALPRGRQLAWMAAGTALFLIVGLAWYTLVLLRVPHALSIWKQELTGYADVDPKSTHFYLYACLLPYLCPWSVFFIIGLVRGFQRRENADRIALCLLLVPILLMSFHNDRYERYLLPMLPAAALVCAAAIAERIRKTAIDRAARWTDLAHWLLVIGVGMGFPVAATGIVQQLVRINGTPWLSQAVALPAAALAGFLILVGISLRKRLPATLVPITFVITLGSAILFMVGYSQTNQGLAEYRPLAEVIWVEAPNAEIYNSHPLGKRPPPEMGVYLSRVLHHVDDPSSITASDVPKVLLMPRRKDSPEPFMPPPWERIGAHIQKQEGWVAFRLPARN